MLLVDSNVLMYAAGSEHPSKAPSVALLEAVARGEVAATLDAEILQEVLHRYRATDRWTDDRKVFDQARRLFPVVLPVTADALDIARELLDRSTRLTARDAVHAGVCLDGGLEGICSFDRDFDEVEELRRFEPRDLLP